MTFGGAAPRPVLSAFNQAIAQGGAFNVAAGAQDFCGGNEHINRCVRSRAVGYFAAAGANGPGSGYPRRHGLNLAELRGTDDQSPALRHEAERHQSERMAPEAGRKNLEKRAILMRAAKDGPACRRLMRHMEERAACRWFGWNGHWGSSVDPLLASKEGAVRRLIHFGGATPR